MRQDTDVSRVARSMAVAGLLVLGTVALGGCSSDNPAAANADNAAGDFPDVNKVPSQRPMPPTTEELSSVTQGLVADRQAARYAQDGTRRAAQEIGAPGPEPTTTAGSTITVGNADPSMGNANTPRVVTSPTVPPMTGAFPGSVGGGTTVIDGAGTRQEVLAYMPGQGREGGTGPRPLSEYNGFGVGVSSKVGVIYFSSSSSNLDGNDLSVVREIAAYQRQYGGVLRVIGHSSSRTGDMDPAHHTLVNLRVSAQRAESVARALMNAGVQGAQIFVGGVADEQKEYQEVMPSGEAFNRRAEVYLDY
ncbi:MAG: OmpA family protein [Rhodospirillum sp.]|nr:OmpA family protein [Rhodospirillum sp.]